MTRAFGIGDAISVLFHELLAPGVPGGRCDLYSVSLARWRCRQQSS